MQVEKAASATLVTLPGTTLPWYESAIYSRVSGYVGKWYADIGDHVKKGQVLAVIDTPELDAALAEAKAKLKSALALIAAREAEAEFAKSTYERWKKSPVETVSEQDRQAKKADYLSAIARLDAANAVANAARDEVDGLTTLTQFKFVTAPYDGTIIERRIDTGDLVSAGSTSDTRFLYRMSQDDPMRVFIDVPQSEAAEIAVGMPTTVTVMGSPNRCYRGMVARTADAIDPQARTLQVEVDVPNPDRGLVPGLYVEAKLVVRTTDAVWVPTSAMMFRTRGPQVAVVDANGTIHFRDVVIARDYGNFLKISSGLKAGDRVAANINNQIVDGQKVSVTDAPQVVTGYASSALTSEDLGCPEEPPY